MDATDLAILRAMGLHPFEPWSTPASLRTKSIARAVGTTEKTVRERVRKLERDGTLAGYEAYPNLRHLGLAWSTFHYIVPTRAKARALAAIEDVEGVTAIQDNVGEDVYVDLYYANDEEMRARMRLLKSLLGEGALDRVDHKMPAVRRSLTPLDWRIVSALRGRARRPSREIARELGVTVRTVERRISAMLAAGDLYVVPRVDRSRAPNLTPFMLLVEASPGELPRLAKAAPAVAPGCCQGSWAPTCCEPSEAHLTVALYASSTAQMESIRAGFAGREGVVGARVILPAGRREPRGWLDALVRRFAEGSTADATQGTPLVSRMPASRPKRR